MRPIYLDYMATTPVDPRVAKRMNACLTLEGNFGNPSSMTHSYGRSAQQVVEQARQQVADLVNTSPESLIWTSGATEANNLAIKGAAHFYRRQGQHIVTCQTEHKSVLDPCAQLQREGFEVTYLVPNSNGLLDLNILKAALRKDTLLVSIAHANSEIGVVQDIAAIGKLTRERGVLFHVDAAQSAGKIPVDLQKLSVDLMSFSAHKIYGPKGIGALYMCQKPKVRLEPLFHGGGQERGVRAGTLPVHQIVGMGEAFAIAKSQMQQESEAILKLRDYLWSELKKITKVYVNGDLVQRLPGNLNVSFAGIDAQALIEALPNVAVSSGSACTSGNIEPSYVLRALGTSESLARSAIRFSIGRYTTLEEIKTTLQFISQVIPSMSTRI